LVEFPFCQERDNERGDRETENPNQYQQNKEKVDNDEEIVH